MLTVSTGTYCKKTQILHVSKRTIRYAESMVDQVYIEIYSFYVILKYNHFCHCDLEILHCFNYKKKNTNVCIYMMLAFVCFFLPYCTCYLNVVY